MPEMTPENSTLRKRWAAYRPSKAGWFWSCVACVIATVIVGFTAGGWVTGGKATRLATEAANSARAELAAAVCVSQFEKGPDAQARFAELKKTSYWERDDFITKGGWVTMPGLKEPVTGAADLCAKKLEKASLPTTAAATGASG